MHPEEDVAARNDPTARVVQIALNFNVSASLTDLIKLSTSDSFLICKTSSMNNSDTASVSPNFLFNTASMRDGPNVIDSDVILFVISPVLIPSKSLVNSMLFPKGYGGH